MKILVNNDVKEMTSEQEAALMEMPDQTPELTTEERIAVLEDELAAAKILLGLEE